MVYTDISGSHQQNNHHILNTTYFKVIRFCSVMIFFELTLHLIEFKVMVNKNKWFYKENQVGLISVEYLIWKKYM